MNRGLRRARLHAPLALVAAALSCGRAARAAGDPRPQGAPSVDASRFPAPGSYTLPRIQRCPDGEVLTTDRRTVRLHELLRGHTTVLSFMYTYCRDPIGCPLAYRLMAGTREALLADRALAARVQLASLSFDPTNDTPEQMAIYGHEFARRDAPVRWHFLTTASVPKLLPLLNGLGQDVSIEGDARGQPTRTLNHMLKLFLIDARLTVREVYSVGTVDVAVLVNDLRTLTAQTAGPVPPA